MPERRTGRGLEIELELDRADREHNLKRFISEAIAYLEKRIENLDDNSALQRPFAVRPEKFTFFDVD